MKLNKRTLPILPGKCSSYTLKTAYKKFCHHPFNLSTFCLESSRSVSQSTSKSFAFLSVFAPRISQSIRLPQPRNVPIPPLFLPSLLLCSLRSWSCPRPISSSQLHVLPHFHLCPIYLVVFKGSYYFTQGYLILRGASRLDAFSVYPVPAWLPCHGSGLPTGPPAASPSRSSRTKDSSSQISYAHAGQGPNCLTTF